MEQEIEDCTGNYSHFSPRKALHSDYRYSVDHCCVRSHYFVPENLVLCLGLTSVLALSTSSMLSQSVRQG